MLKKNYWIRSGAYTMLQRIAAFLFGFGSFFFLVRYFSVDTFGVWNLYLVVSTSVEMSRSAFIQNAFVKFFNQADIDRSKLFTGSLFLNLVSTVLFVLILFALIPFLKVYWHSEIISTMILWYCATSIVLIPLTQLNYLEQANHSFAGVFWSAVVRQGSFFVLVILVYFFQPGLSLVFFAGAHFFCALLGLIVCLLLNWRMLPAKYELDRNVVNRLFQFGKYILGTGVTSSVGKNADQVILGGVGHTVVALFNAVIRILNFIEIPSLAISNIVYPKIAERASEGNHHVAELYEKSVASILGIIFPVVFFIALFPKFMITITAGEQYLEAYPLLRIMCLITLLTPFNIQFGTVCEVINRPRVSFLVNLSSSILSVMLNLLLIKFIGIKGATITFCITILFTFIFSQWYLATTVGVHTYRVFVRVLTFYKEAFLTATGLIKKSNV